MNARTITSLIAITIILAYGCTSNKQSKKLQPGYYQLIKTEISSTGNLDIPQKLGFQSGIIHVINDDSLEFAGQNTMGDFLWGHSKFNFKTNRNKIVLSSGDFNTKIKFEITPDNLLKLETNAENMASVYFKPLEVKLAGKYRVFGFTKKTDADNNAVLTFAQQVFSKEYFDFVSTNSVIIQPQLARLLTGKITTDSIFNYQLSDKEITFSTETNTLTIAFIFDGVFRMYINDSDIERIDIGEIKG